MKIINPQNQCLCSFISLIVVLIFTISTTSQSKSNEDDNNMQDSLEGFTEAILLNNQPVLKVLSKKSGSTLILSEMRDGKNSLVFEVRKVGKGNIGKLFITDDKVVFIPNQANSDYVSISKNEIKEVNVKKRGPGFSSFISLEIKTKKDSEKFVANYSSGSFKADTKPVLIFVMKAIQNFDSALAEFNKLTASVRQIDEEDEEFEEDEEVDINEKYDRFKDRTVISTAKMRVKGKKRSIRTYAEYDFVGKTQIKPENITLYFYGSATTPIFREDNLELNFLVDGKRVPLGNMGIADEEKKKTIIRQTVSVSIPYDTFNQIANGKKVEFQIGDLEYMLTDEHLEAFKKFLSYEIEE